MNASVDIIRELREQTNCGIMECKSALEEAGGDINKAKEILKKRGLELAAKKGSRSAQEGKVEAYIHFSNKVGVLVELNCETDFVAKNEDFCAFAKDLAMHIAAASPKYVSKDDIPQEELKEAKDQDAYIKEVCLLEQPFVKDQSQTIQDCINALISKIGENIIVGRFIRYKVGVDH